MKLIHSGMSCLVLIPLKLAALGELVHVHLLAVRVGGPRLPGIVRLLVHGLDALRCCVQVAEQRVARDFAQVLVGCWRVFGRTPPAVVDLEQAIIVGAVVVELVDVHRVIAGLAEGNAKQDWELILRETVPTQQRGKRFQANLTHGKPSPKDTPILKFISN